MRSYRHDKTFDGIPGGSGGFIPRKGLQNLNEIYGCGYKFCIGVLELNREIP